VRILSTPTTAACDTSLAFSHKVRDAGIAPSMGAVGSAYDNAMVESFGGRMQVELFRKRWKTRVGLATAIHDYIELFQRVNPRRERAMLDRWLPTSSGGWWSR
jgi:putative transposase